MKKCTKCNKVKELSEYSKSSKKKDGKRSQCKVCDAFYRNSNSEKNLEYRKQYYLKNKEQILLENKIYRLANIDRIRKQKKQARDPYKIQIRSKKYYLNNKCVLNEKSKVYQNKNKVVLGEKRRLRNLYRRNTDDIYKLKCNVRRLIQISFTNRSFRKKSKTFEILGCTPEEFYTYLENKFEAWMNWENKGLYNGEFNYGWDLDHIIPLVSAKTEEEIIKLNHYTNFQPLCGKFNREIKNGKF